MSLALSSNVHNFLEFGPAPVQRMWEVTSPGNELSSPDMTILAIPYDRPYLWSLDDRATSDLGLSNDRKLDRADECVF